MASSIDAPDPNASAAAPLATLTLLRVAPRHRGFAVSRITRARWELASVPGADGARVRFLGSGAGPKGLSAIPGTDRYGLLVPSWATVEDARRFLDASPWMTAYRARAVEVLHLFLRPISGHGRWDGEQPFPAAEGARADGAGATPLAVLTRATVRATSLPSFFKASARIEADLDRCGALLAVGLGDLPWIRQATFSVWPGLGAMRRFAYEEPAHREAMRAARAHGWFLEDLFVRFRVVARQGTWGGVDPLVGFDLPETPASAPA